MNISNQSENKETRLTKKNLVVGESYEIYNVNKRDGDVRYYCMSTTTILNCKPNQEFLGTREKLGVYTGNKRDYAPKYNGMLHYFDNIKFGEGSTYYEKNHKELWIDQQICIVEPSKIPIICGDKKSLFPIIFNESEDEEDKEDI